MTKNRYLLFIICRNKNYALFSIDKVLNNAIICFQGNPRAIEGKTNKVFFRDIEEARVEWKKLKDKGWNPFKKGLITGAAIQRIKSWFLKMKNNHDKLHKCLLMDWKKKYDEKTPAYICELKNNEITEINILGEPSNFKFGGFSLHSRMGVGAFEGTETFYLPGTVPKQRGKRMR